MNGFLSSTSADAKTVHPIVDTLFDTVLHDEDPTVRSRIVDALGGLSRWNADVRKRLNKLRTTPPDTNDRIRIAVHNAEQDRGRTSHNR